MFAGASLDENSGAFCELKANFFRLILTKAELRALTAEDFDFEKNILSITKSYQKIKGKDVITKPKTKKSIRKVYMPEQVAREMEDFIHGIYGYSQMKDCFRFPNHIYTMRWIEALRLVA